MYRVLGKGGFGEVCACQVGNNTIQLSILFICRVQFNIIHLLYAGSRHWQNVCMQKIREEAYKKAQGRVNGFD